MNYWCSIVDVFVERWEGLEVFNKKPRIALANPESSHKQLISASDAVSRMKGKL